MAYEPQYTKPYIDGWKNLPEETTPITAETLNTIDTAMVAVEEQLVATTEVFDEQLGSVFVGNKDKTVKPMRSAILGSLNAITSMATYCLIAGYNNIVNATNNIVGGTKNTVNSNASDNVISGNNNTLVESSGGNNVSGSTNNVDGNYNVVGGDNNTVEAIDANVVGKGLKTFKGNYGAQQIAGQYNNPDENIDGSVILFGIGNGTSDTARSNAVLLDKNGNLQVQGKLLQNGGDEITAGAKKTAVYSDYSLAVSALNSATNTDFEAGQTIRISESGIPDLWIVSVATTKVSYSSSGNLVTDIKNTGTVQIGYYNVALVEAYGFEPSSINSNSHYDYVQALLNAGDSYFERIKMAVGQTVHIQNTTQADLYIYSKESSKASYTYMGDLEGDIIAAGGLLQVGYYKIGMVKGYVDFPTYEETLAILNAEEQEVEGE